jgi:hypothetical protein
MFRVTNEKKKRDLKQWIAGGQQWISVDEAIELIKTSLATTLGHARKLLLDARASGEVRYANDDGLVKDPRFDYAFRKDDLEGWLDRHHPQRHAQKNRAKVKFDRAKEAITAIWPNGPPDALVNDTICTQAIDWIKADCKEQKIPFVDIGRSTILRAAGRKE